MRRCMELKPEELQLLAPLHILHSLMVVRVPHTTLVRCRFRYRVQVLGSRFEGTQNSGFFTKIDSRRKKEEELLQSFVPP